MAYSMAYYSRDTESCFVCWNCLVQNPCNRDLMRYQCNNNYRHKGRKENDLQVRVWWWENEKCLEVYPPGGYIPLPQIRQKPQFGRRYVLCRYYRKCERGQSCSYAHSISEMMAWNNQADLDLDLKNEARSARSAMLGDFIFPQSSVVQEVVGDASPDPINGNEESAKLILSMENYQEKFQALIELEQRAHIKELYNQCDGGYEFSLIEKESRWLSKDSRYLRCGYLRGLNGNQISYAGQASRQVIMEFDDGSTVEADVLAINNSHVDDCLYIGFTGGFPQNLPSRKCKTSFKLNFSYFERLRDSVKNVRPEVIQRIIPDSSKFQQTDDTSVDLTQCNLRSHLKNCSHDQVNALQIALSRKPHSPPILISGPFGSGKTRILALLSHYYLSPDFKFNRILVCTQQHTSANAFYLCFDELNPKKDKDLEVIRLVPDYYNQDRGITCFRTLRDIKSAGPKDGGRMLIITTCSSAITMYTRKILPVGFFTHVFIDEGAQMREPEAIAPLNFATKNTKIVIAGDYQQVGPAMLVLGDIPQEHGLAVSLIERLHKLYTNDLKDVAKSHFASLTSNFRCCSDITTFCGKAFYQTELESKVKTFDDYFSFKFICSDLDAKMTPGTTDSVSVRESEIVINQVEDLYSDWKSYGEWGTRDCSQICITSPTRSQLTVTKQMMRDYKEDIKKVQKVPIYDIQGKEFLAVIISTYEPMDDEASPLNPTKSISNPFVFNTVLSRSKYLVVAVGNPFNLLRKEEEMVEKYGQKGKCWSRFIKLCREKNTFHFDSSIPEKSTPFFMTMLGNVLYKNCDSTTETDAAEEPEPEPAPDKVDDRRTQKMTKFDDDFEEQTYIGEGAFGIVFKVTKKRLERGSFAVKVIRMPVSKTDKRHVIREIKALSKLNHPNIVRYFSSWTDPVPIGAGRKEIQELLSKQSESYTYAIQQSSSTPSTPTSQTTDEGESPEEEASLENKCLFIQMELCSDGTLKDWFKCNERKRKKYTVTKYMKQILDAVEYIHGKDLIHRDLKPANILFAGGDIKVGDFGLVTDHDGSNLGSQSESLGPINGDERHLTSRVGTKMYNSPEQLAGEKYGSKVDMYATGLIFLELFYPYTEYQSERVKVFDEVRKTERIPEKVRSKFNMEAELIEKLLVNDCKKRLSAKDFKETECFEKLLCQNIENSLSYYELESI